MLVMLGAFVIIVIRLFYLQISTSLALFYRSKRNYLRYEAIVSPRGSLCDRYGRQLATNRPIVSLVWHGTGNRYLTPSQLGAVEKLNSLGIITCDSQELAVKERQRRKYMLVEELSFNQLSVLMEQFPEHANVKCETRMQRYYPQGSLACHVLGYISLAAEKAGNAHCVGVMGLERAFDSLLRGVPGQMLTTINSCGHCISQQELQQALGGEAIYTTIDSDYQRIAEDCFPEHERGAIIVMEATTGALRVVVSRPGFDPNLFTRKMSSPEWQGLVEEQAFLNRAFSACYPPASLFKLVTMIAALDTGIIGSHERWYCPGYAIFAGRPYRCMNRDGHGHVTIEDAIGRSCNIPFYDIASKLKINTLAVYAQCLGLGTPTNSVIGEKIGLIPTTQWKYERFREQWWPGESLSASIGQSYNLITPAQAARMIAAVCEGYRVAPFLLKGHTVERVAVPINPAVLERIKESMLRVAREGTGKALKHLKMRLYAKTGTAQTRNLSSQASTTLTDEQRQRDSHAWFAAHVTYKQDTPFVIVVLLEHAGSSRHAVQVAKKFLEAYQKLVDGLVQP
jgi:penicillin-binding protein 2